MCGGGGSKKKCVLLEWSGREEAEPVVVVCPQPRRIHPYRAGAAGRGGGSSSDLLGPHFLDNILPNSNTNNKERKELGKKSKAEEEMEEEGLGLLGGSPPVRANNPLIHDPHFLLNPNQNLGVAFPDSSHRRRHLPPIRNSPTSSSNSLVPVVRIQGFDTCRSSQDGGGRVLSARA